jgi:hypothetical protein
MGDTPRVTMQIGPRKEKGKFYDSRRNDRNDCCSPVEKGISWTEVAKVVGGSCRLYLSAIALEHPEFIEQKVTSHGRDVSQGYRHQRGQKMACEPDDCQVDHCDAATDRAKSYELQYSWDRNNEER